MSNVCVIGAGPAGITMARLLRTRGYTVTVLEKTDRVGGMCKSFAFTEPGRNLTRDFDIGANYITKDYREVRRLADSLGFDLVTDTAFQNQQALSVATGTVVPATAIANAGHSMLAFGWASLKYLWLQWRYRHVINAPGFLGVADHDDLMTDFGTWLERHGLQPLWKLFMIPVTAFCYGQLNEIATPYALKYLDASRFWSMLLTGLHVPQSWPKRVARGFGNLWVAAASDIGVETLTMVSNVTRTPGRVTITSSHAGIEQTRDFDTLVLAMPFDKALPFLDATDAEQRLFGTGAIIYNDFRLNAARVPDFPYEVVIELEATPDDKGAYPADPGHPWIFGKQWSDSELLLFYAPVPHGTDERLVQRLAETDCGLACTAGGRGSWQGLVNSQQWPEYFPHVTPAAMASFADTGEGWYDLVEAMQGTQNTYYVNGVMAFGLVESIMRYCRALVETRFPQRSA